MEIDKPGRGYIVLDQLFIYIHERPYSIIAPYMERFFELIDKLDLDRVTFEELLGALVAFCLFSKDEMITCTHYLFILIVVFNMLDRDHDDEISKKDLFRVFTMEREDLVVFPYNNMRTVELIDVDRGDKIHKSDFVTLVVKFPYLVFPAFRLQSSMKECFGGFSFWRKCKVKLEKKELERKMQAERDKFFERNKKKKEAEYAEKLEYYEEKVKELNTEYRKV